MAKASLVKPGAALHANKATLRKPAEPEPIPDPLADVEYTGDLCEDAARELSALDVAFKQTAKAEKRKHAAVIDTEFWVALCFESRAQKEAFLRALNLLADGDKYLDGRKLAAAIGLELPVEAPPFRERGIDPKLAALAL